MVLSSIVAGRDSLEEVRPYVTVVTDTEIMQRSAEKHLFGIL